jgi:hypothetical protein
LTAAGACGIIGLSRKAGIPGGEGPSGTVIAKRPSVARSSLPRATAFTKEAIVSQSRRAIRRLFAAIATLSMMTVAAASGHSIQTAAYTIRGFEFVGPTALPAGMTALTLTNETDRDGDIFALIKIGGGRTLDDFFQAMGELMSGELLVVPEWVTFVGGSPIGVDDTRSYTTFLSPGSYHLVSIGADEDGPFAARGLVLPIEVEAPAVDFDAAVTLRDYEFVIDGELTAGPQVLRVHNDANQIHEMIMFPLPPGMSVEDMLMAMEEGGDEGGPPGSMVQGMWAIDPGVTVYVTVDLVPGTYGILCFIPDADGPHFMSGMVAEVNVN